MMMNDQFKRPEMNKHILIHWKSIIPAIMFGASCYAVFLISNPLYLSSDNIGVAIVVDGYYGSENYCQYLHPLLCLLIRFLTPLLPTADIFTLLIHIFIALQIGMLFLLFTGDLFKKPVRRWTIYDAGIVLAVGMTVLLFTSGITIWNANYTITTGAVTLFGLVVCFESERKKKKPSWIILGTVTLCFSCMLRQESALLFLPFVALEVVANHLSSRANTVDSVADFDDAKLNGTVRDKYVLSASRKNMKSIQLVQYRLLPMVVMIILLFASRSVFHAREPYRTAARYNAARTICVDFPMSPWDAELETSSDGIFTANDYAAATDWCFFDTDFFDAEMMERIATVGGKNRYELNSYGFKGALNEMRYTLFHSSLYMVILILLTVVLAIRNVICCGIWRKAETVLAILGGFMIIIYFTFRGRAPMRVWEPVIFAIDFCMLRAALEHQPAAGYQLAESQPNATLSQDSAPGVCGIVNHVCFVIMFIILWFSTGQIIAHSRYYKPQPVWMSRIPLEGSAFDATVSDAAGEDALFIWPNWHAHIPEEVQKTGRLPSREIVKHNIALGDWVYGQPYFNEFLKNSSAENPAAALLNRTNTYIMGGQNDLAGSYLKEHAKDLSQIAIGGKPKAADGDRIIQFEPVPELGVIDDLYSNKVKYIYKDGTAGR